MRSFSGKVLYDEVVGKLSTRSFQWHSHCYINARSVLDISADVQLRVKSFATLAPNLSPTITTTTTTTHYNYVNTACFWT